MKKLLSLFLVGMLSISMLSGCRDSSTSSVVGETDYDAVAEVARFDLEELSQEDKDYVVEMGYRDCDHMVASIIGEKAGIYEALGLTVNITKTGKIMEAMSSGQMDVGYQGIFGLIDSINSGAPLFMAGANHVGGSMYLVVSNNIEKPEDLIGKKIAIGSGAMYDPAWNKYAKELGIPVELENYEVLDMSDKDAMFAMKAGQLDAFTCCDPYASQAEFEGFGKIMGTDWSVTEVDTNSQDGWGICCSYCMNDEFYAQHPALAERLILAHSLAIEYLYTHPYNAGMMFAEGFGVDPEVGLRTVYMKTVAEGRTITWEFDQSNIENHLQYYIDFGIPSEEMPNVDDMADLIGGNITTEFGCDDFWAFIKEKVDPIFPVGLSYEEWMEKAKTIDGITA